jgi:hypothetical protein
MRIRDGKNSGPEGKNLDPGWKTFGSGIRMNIPDAQHCILDITSLIKSHRTEKTQKQPVLCFRIRVDQH